MIFESKLIPSSLVLVSRPSGLSEHPPDVQANILTLYLVYGIVSVILPEDKMDTN